MDYDVIPLTLDRRQQRELPVRADEFRIDFDRFVLSAAGIIKFFFLLVHAPELIPRHGVPRINLNGFQEIPLGICPLLFLYIAETFVIGVSGVLRRRSRRDAKSETLNVRETTQANDSDVRIIKGLP